MIANYVRLGANLLIGLVIVPVLFATVGEDGFGLIGLMMAAIGISNLFQQIVERSMIRQLAAAWHSEEPNWFESVYNAAAAISAGVAFLTIVPFIALVLVLPVLAEHHILLIPARLVPAAQLYAAARGVEAFFLILLAPQASMYLATERMLGHNALILTRRVAYLVAALSLLLLPGWSVSSLVVLYVVQIVVYGTLGLFAFSAYIMVRERARLALRPSLITRRAIKEVVGIGGWNVLVITATNLHERLDAIVMNVVYGLFGNAIFELSGRLAAYIRMAVSGMTTGLDAVAARISSTGDTHAMSRLVFHGTRLHGLVAFPSLVGLAILTEPILRFWIRGGGSDRQTLLSLTVPFLQILAVGWAARSISDGWMYILYGAGHIRRYAWWVLAGGICNPLMAILLLWLMPLPLRYTAAAWAFATSLTVVHFLLLPVLGAPMLGLRVRDLLEPLIRPAAAASISGWVLLAAIQFVNRWTLGLLAAAMVGYAVLYGLLTWMMVFVPGERKRILDQLRRRLNRRHERGSGSDNPRIG